MTHPTVHLEDIRLLEERLHRPEARHSRPALEALLAEGFVEFGASGTVYGRAEIIDLLLQEDDAGQGALQTCDYALRCLAADVVLLTYRTQRIGADGSERQVLRSSIWKHGGSGWQMVFHQGTVTSGPVQPRG